MINPKNIFDKAVNEFGFRKTTAIVALGVCCAFGGVTIGVLAIPNEPTITKAIQTATEAAKTAVQTVTENIIEKENV